MKYEEQQNEPFNLFKLGMAFPSMPLPPMSFSGEGMRPYNPFVGGMPMGGMPMGGMPMGGMPLPPQIGSYSQKGMGISLSPNQFNK